MNDHDASLDALLRRQSDGPVADDGFSDRVLQHVPARRRTRRWQLPAAILLGLGACGWSLSATPLLRAGWQDWLRGQVSPSAVALLLALATVSLLASWWALAESD